MHQELGNDQFIGAIYSERLTESADVLLAADIPMRMEMKITADRGIAARRFSRLWIEGMAINNRSDALTQQADNMVAFTNMFTSRLREGDHIIFSLAPGNGVTVSVDSIELGRIDNDQFFSMLVSTWVGRVPLSSTFREQLLVGGDVSDSLQDRYASLNPSAERIDQVAAWIAPPEPEPTPEPEPEPEPEAATVAAATAAATQAENEVAAVATPEPPKLEIPQQEAEPEPEPEPQPRQTAAVSAPEPTVRSSSSAAPAPTPEPQVDESDEDYVPTFTAESLLASQRYFSQMVRKVQLEIEYPRRALQRGYEGFVRIAVAVDRSGNLLNAELLEETDHSVLNNEAMEAVEDAAPFANIPDVISGRTHEFTIPITFALSN
ncbi:TonB family protein [Gilvimarinus sp. HB14]|uniref:Protein TonB n=1 Tax=Gilvimarinus xylanilyticus TaxID=2944139 RepID=A0A9X2KUU7_9GAMM|nr:TonB family protein [Gilvimarinus xylanilyticus]